MFSTSYTWPIFPDGVDGERNETEHYVIPMDGLLYGRLHTDNTISTNPLKYGKTYLSLTVNDAGVAFSSISFGDAHWSDEVNFAVHVKKGDIFYLYSNEGVNAPRNYAHIWLQRLRTS